MSGKGSHFSWEKLGQRSILQVACAGDLSQCPASRTAVDAFFLGRTLDSSSNGVGPGSLKQTAEEVSHFEFTVFFQH